MLSKSRRSLNMSSKKERDFKLSLKLKTDLNFVLTTKVCRRLMASHNGIFIVKAT